MTTSKRSPGPGLPPGWPDTEVLERLANQFFHALPGRDAEAPADVSLPSPGTAANPGGPDSTPYPSSWDSAYSSPPATEIPGQATDGLESASPLGATLAPAIELPWQDPWKLLNEAVPPSVEEPLPAARETAGGFYFLEYQPSAPPLPQAGFPSEGFRPPEASAPRPFDVHRVREDFPIFKELVNGRPLIWLDNAATTQKPRQVIERIAYFYEHENSNIHRAAHELAARATDAYEGAREKVRRFLNASSVNEIVFVRGATEAINLVAQTWGRKHIGKDDELLVSHLEHHANIVPWQQLANETGAKLRVIPVDGNGQIVQEEVNQLLGPKTKLVSFTQVSNALGTITPAKQIIDAAHRAGARVLLDGAQAVPHLPADVQAMGPDWYVFSGHKVFAPTGIGVLYGKEEVLNEMPPWQGGGNMIEDVTFERILYQNAPARFEAGTGNIADAVGLGAAIDYLSSLGMDLISAYEHELLLYATDALQNVPGLRLIGTAPDKASVLSFVLEGHRTEDVGGALNREGIAVRSGHHCAQPILRRFGLESTVRPSLAFYNTFEEIDRLTETLLRLQGGRGAAIRV